MSDQYLGEIRAFGFNFAPVGWAQCNGQLLSIQQYTALFSLLGTYYGGNGTSNFGLPDMRGRAPLSQSTNGQYNMGQMSGTETVTLNTAQVPQHNHFARAVSSAPTTTNRPVNNIFAQSTASGSAAGAVYTGATNLITINQATIQPYGQNQPHNNLQPYLAMTYCIALAGIYPSRN